MTRLRSQIVALAASSASVLVSGPAGSGKELVARAIHAVSNPPGSALLRLDARHMPDNLAPGQDGNSRSWTDNTTIFIKNVEDLPARHVDNLLDLNLSAHTGLDRHHENLRMIFSTHDADIRAKNGIGAPRHVADFLNHLAPAHIDVAPLCQHPQDIPLIISHFRSGRADRAVAIFDEQALDRIMSHDWPGNIGQLKNFIHLADQTYADRMAGEKEVDELLDLTCPVIPHSQHDNGDDQLAGLNESVNLKAMVEDMERTYIIRALAGSEGVITQAARQLQLKRTTLIEKMRKYGLDRAV